MPLLRLRSDVLLVLACLALYVGAAAQITIPGGSALEVAVKTATRPVLAAANATGKGWKSLMTYRRGFRAARQQLTALEEEVERLRRENQIVIAELAALREADTLLSEFPSYRDGTVVARVIARDLLTSHTVRLDRGLDDDVRLDATVLAGSGILGRIDRVAPASSRVQLLTHPAAAAAARLADIQGEYLLMGGSPPRLTGLPPFVEIPEGTPVITTASEGIYPRDLLLGVTAGVRSDQVFTVVDVDLLADPRDISVVLVLPPAEEAP